MKTLVLRILDGLARDHETTGGFDLIADLIGKVASSPTDMGAIKKIYLKTKGYG